MSSLSAFAQGVVRWVRAIPPGKVVSYGQVATLIGMPRAARQVGWALRRLDGVAMPWWRVINNAGKISIAANLLHDREEQRDLLRAEGVPVGEDFSIDISRHRWWPKTHLPVT